MSFLFNLRAMLERAGFFLFGLLLPAKVSEIMATLTAFCNAGGNNILVGADKLLNCGNESIGFLLFVGSSSFSWLGK
jgi:hypothetical protein